MRRTYLILLGVLGVGIFLRLFALSDKSLWTDELVTINNAVGMINLNSFFGHTQSDDLPKFYSLLLKFWMFFGIKGEWLRSFSVLFGSLSIIVTYAICRLIFDNKVALLAAFLVAISPLLILYDREIRMYPLFVFLSLLSTYYFILALRSGKKSCWILFSIVNILNLYTHYYAFLTIFVQWLYFIVRYRDNRQFIKPWLIVNAAIFGCFAIRLSAFIGDVLYHAPWALPRERFPFIFAKGFVEFFYIFYSFSIGQTVLPWNPVGIITAAIVMAIFILALKKELFRSKEILYLCMLIFIPIIIGLIFRISMPRYFTFIVPIFCMFIARGISLFPKKIIVCSMIVIVLGWGYSISNYYNNKQFHIQATIDPWREIGQYLKDNVKENDEIYVVGIGVVPLRYYYKELLEGYSGDDLLNKMSGVRQSNIDRIWLIFAYQEEYNNWLNARDLLLKDYIVVKEMKWIDDPDYELKRKLFKRDFSPHRVVAELYERKNNN